MNENNGVRFGTDGLTVELVMMTVLDVVYEEYEEVKRVASDNDGVKSTIVGLMLMEFMKDVIIKKDKEIVPDDDRMKTVMDALQRAGITPVELMVATTIHLSEVGLSDSGIAALGRILNQQ